MKRKYFTQRLAMIEGGLCADGNERLSLSNPVNAVDSMHGPYIFRGAVLSAEREV